MHCEPAVNAGVPPMSVLAAPGTQGAVIVGTHGIGVRTPSAALVAAATVGLARLEHIPNGGMFTPVIVLVMTAAGRPSIVTRGVGRALSVDGASPKVHCNIAPVTAQRGIGDQLLFSAYLFDPLTEAVSLAPVVVTKQRMLRSSFCSQLRGEGSR
jgi:hypothetical protein